MLSRIAATGSGVTEDGGGAASSVVASIPGRSVSVTKCSWGEIGLGRHRGRRVGPLACAGRPGLKRALPRFPAKGSINRDITQYPASVAVGYPGRTGMRTQF